MSDDERIVYDFLTELNRTKRVSIPRSNARSRFGRGRRGSDRINGYYALLAMQLTSRATPSRKTAKV